MRRVVAGIVAALTCASSGLTASATSTATAWSFHGDCSFTGLVRFTPPVTGTPQQGRGTATATGTCTGTLTTRHRTHNVTSARASYWATDTSPQMDCQGGPATGYGWLRIGRIKLRFALTETRIVAVAFLELAAETWSGDGAANTDAAASPTDEAEACGTSGLRSSPIDIRLHA